MTAAPWLLDWRGGARFPPAFTDCRNCRAASQLACSEKGKNTYTRFYAQTGSQPPKYDFTVQAAVGSIDCNGKPPAITNAAGAGQQQKPLLGAAWAAAGLALAAAAAIGGGL